MKRTLVLLAGIFLLVAGCSTAMTTTAPRNDAIDTDPSHYLERVLLDASQSAPVKLSGDEIPVEQVPMFIVLGFDDNGIADSAFGGGTTWIMNYLDGKTNNDGSSVHASFYLTGKYGAEYVYESPERIRDSWKALYDAGHETGVHSMQHLMWWNTEEDNGTYDGRSYTLEEWAQNEFDPVIEVLTTAAPDGVGIPREDLVSWRTPRLEWNNAVFTLLKNENMLYDCSVESDPSADPQNEYWPFTMDHGCPWNATIESHPGLWELPAYNFHIPDSLVEKAGMSVVTGFDYNVWGQVGWGGLELNGPDFTEILKYNLDQRMLGNRAPLLIGLHSDIYTDSYGKNEEYPGTQDARARQLAIENFIDYAMTTYPEVRFVSGTELVAWLKNPVPIPAE